MNKDTGTALREIRKQKNLRLEDVADAEGVGLDAGNLSRIERGVQGLDARRLEAIVRALGLGMSEFYGYVERGGSGGLVEAVYPGHLPSDVVQIGVSRVRFAAGEGQVAATYELEEDAEPVTYKASWFQRERLRPERCKRFKVKGQSQEPYLFNGDWILVNLDETHIVPHSLYALRYGDDLRAKFVDQRIDGSMVLRSYNAPEEIVSPQNVAEHISIIGRVRDKGGPGGLRA